MHEKCNQLQEDLNQKRDTSTIHNQQEQLLELKQELALQRSLNKNRDQLLQELADKQQSIRQAETQGAKLRQDLQMTE